MASSAKSVCNPSSSPFLFLVCCLRRPELLSAAHVAHTGDRGLGARLLLVFMEPHNKILAGFWKKAIVARTFSAAKKNSVVVVVVVVGWFLDSKTLLLHLDRCRLRWSTLQSTFPIFEKRKHLRSGCWWRSVALPSFFIPRFTALFWRLMNTNNKNNNKNRTHAHSHTPGDRRCGDPYAAAAPAASADALQTRTGNDFHTPTHAHTRTHTETETDSSCFRS